MSANGGADVRLVTVDVVAARETSTGRATLAILVAGVELRVETGTGIGYVSEVVMALRSRC